MPSRKLRRFCGVLLIPQLVVFDCTGVLLSASGKGDIRDLGFRAWDAWFENAKKVNAGSHPVSTVDLVHSLSTKASKLVCISKSSQVDVALAQQLILVGADAPGVFCEKSVETGKPGFTKTARNVENQWKVPSEGNDGFMVSTVTSLGNMTSQLPLAHGQESLRSFEDCSSEDQDELLEQFLNSRRSRLAVSGKDSKSEVEKTASLSRSSESKCGASEADDLETCSVEVLSICSESSSDGSELR